MRNQAYEKWKKQMLLAAREKCIPIVGHFELTARCNLDCKMCFIHGQESNALRDRELSTDDWKRIFDEAYDCGMLFAELTGGECLLRKDFKELYLHLWNKRICITVMTNGTLINDDFIAFFKKYPPATVQISLYGSNEEGYLRVTGHRGFEKAVAAINALTELRIPVYVAVTPSSYMRDDFINIRRFCKEHKYWCNPSEFYLANKRDESQSDSCDLTIDEIVELAKQQALLQHSLIPVEQTPPYGGICTQPPKGTICNAGKCYSAISWEGLMYPCSMLPLGEISVKEMSYAEAWEETKKVAQNILLGAECVGCPYDSVCPKCPMMRLAGFDTGHCNPKVCEVTRKLVEAGVKKLPKEE